jgi:hypothetical protein
MIKTSIIDGNGTGNEAVVAPSGKVLKNALYVNIAGVSPGFSLPTAAGVTGNLYDELLSLNSLGVTTNMNVNGSVTNQVFSIAPNDDTDVLVSEIVVFSYGGSVQLSKFFSISALSNGCLLEIKADNITTNFRSFKSTNDFDFWSSIGGFTYRSEAGGDNAKAILQFKNSIPIRADGTFGPGNNDYIKFTIRDNLSAISNLYISIRGVEIEKGLL